MEINARGSEKSLSFCCLKIDNIFCVSRLTREGSGNFLIIAYKEIRRLEIKILQLLGDLQNNDSMPLSVIHLGNFNGIELDDFAHEVARLSLWIAEHQMNKELEEAIPGTIAELLPLKDAGNIICANSLRIDWNEVLPHSVDQEVYLMGNPPYYGARKQTPEQKDDLSYVFKNYDVSIGNLDYISGWFLKATEYIDNTKARVSFVSTNSIIQGTQVPLLWSLLLKENVCIDTAYTSFKWGNSAKNQAGVVVVIIGMCAIGNLRSKKIFSGSSMKIVDNISPYLTDSGNVIVFEKQHPISDIKSAVTGSMPNDNGFLIIERDDFESFISNEPDSSKFLRKFIGAKEYLNDTWRYSIWVDDLHYPEADKFHNLHSRFEKVKKNRLESKRDATNRLASTPYRFGEVRHKEEPAIIIPQTSSENRDYIPMGVVYPETIISQKGIAVYGGEVWLLGLLESRMHMIWVKNISGRMKTDYSYSIKQVYNTFPIKNLSTQRKNEITRVMTEILDLREYEGGSLASLYNKDTMPESLRKKHEELDGIVDRAYQQRPFESDEDRLGTLLKLYQEMTTND